MAFGFLDSAGSWLIGFIHYGRQLAVMVYLAFRAAFVGQSQGLRTVFGVISAQIYFTGWQAMPLMTVLALASGVVVILQSSANLSLLGGTEMIGNLLVAIIVRELAPLMTALVVIARSGTAVASELGNMRVNREIEALEAMGINPNSYIIFPRVIGGLLSVVTLAFYFNAIALGGGFLVSRLIHEMPVNLYVDSLTRAFTVEDVYLFLLKNAVGGTMIFIISSFHGLQVGRSPSEVPQMTTKAVMNSIIFVTFFNMSVTILFYLGQLMKLGII